MIRLFLFFAAAANALVAKAGKAGADERSHDEEPHLTHGAPTVAL